MTGKKRILILLPLLAFLPAYLFSSPLSVNGKLSKELVAKMEVDDLPPPYRLACQFIVRDEDILVEFSGEPGVEIDLRR